MEKLKLFLLINYPRIWRAKLIPIFLFSLICSLSIIVINFISTNLNRADIVFGEGPYYDPTISRIEFLLVAWPLLIVVWLYFQYRNKPFLITYSLYEFLISSIINGLCVLLALLPLIVLVFNLVDNYEYFYKTLHRLAVIGFYTYTPMVFLPFIINFYSFREIFLVTVFGFIYFFGLLFLLQIFFTPQNHGSVIFGVINYAIALIYVVIKLSLKRYTALDKWIILVLVITAPYFIDSLYCIMNHILLGTSYYEALYSFDYDIHYTIYLLNYTIIFTYLMTFLWYVNKIFLKPIVIK